MGQHADDLALTLQAQLDAINEDAVRLHFASSALDMMADSVSAIVGDLGITGEIADASDGELTLLVSDLRRTADSITRAQTAAEQAGAAVAAAQEAYHALPEGKLSFTQRAALTAGGTIALPGIGTVAATVAGEIWSNQRESDRESAAKKALTNLAAAITDATVTLHAGPDYGGDLTPQAILPATAPIDQAPVSAPSATGTTSRWLTTSGVSAWSAAGTSPAATAGTTPWTTTGTGSSLGTTTDTGTLTGSPTGSTNGSTTTIGGAPVGGTSPVGGGTTSADGTVSGYVPGGGTTGTGLGIGTTPGLGGLGGSSGQGSGLGGSAAGAGALAGGVAVGGAALGAAGVGRLGGSPTALGAGLGIGGGLGIGATGTGAGAGSGTAGGTFLGGGQGATAGAGSRSTSGASGSGLTGTSGRSGLVAGSSTTASTTPGAGQGSTTLGPQGGGAGAAGGSAKSRRTTASGYLAPQLEDDDTPTSAALTARARAGSRDQLPTAPEPDLEADESW